MTVDYRETTEDLQTRIDIHQQYGSKDIDKWMLELLKPKQGISILDVGCGSGKQLMAFHQYLDGEAKITGGDINEELLEQARERNASVGDAWEVNELDFNERFPLPDEAYDLVSCCFAIYYSADIPITVSEIRRVLKPGGRLFTTGPMPQNKATFYEVIKEATGKPIPPMPGSSRYDSEILGTIRHQFADVDTHIFENPLEFDSAEPFIAYTRASLSEDRGLWTPLFETSEGFEGVMTQIEGVARGRIADDHRLVMTKVVGGFVATK
ncbi:MAG: class I SAM-dependent methyltransferase [Anaerolineales bacterium]